MSPIVSPGATSAPIVHPDTLQRRRIAARVSVSPEVAGVLAALAFGPARDSVLVVAVADAATLAGEASR